MGENGVLVGGGKRQADAEQAPQHQAGRDPRCRGHWIASKAR